MCSVAIRNDNKEDFFTVKMERGNDFRFDKTATYISIKPNWPYRHIATERSVMFVASTTDQDNPIRGQDY